MLVGQRRERNRRKLSRLKPVHGGGVDGDRLFVAAVVVVVAVEVEVAAVIETRAAEAEAEAEAEAA